MSYSCVDFTDSIIEALNLTIPISASDTPSDQADIAVAEIERLLTIEREVRLALKRLNGDDSTGPHSFAERVAQIIEEADATIAKNLADFADDDEEGDESEAA